MGQADGNGLDQVCGSKRAQGSEGCHLLVTKGPLVPWDQTDPHVHSCPMPPMLSAASLVTTVTPSAARTAAGGTPRWRNKNSLTICVLQSPPVPGPHTVLRAWGSGNPQPQPQLPCAPSASLRDRAVQPGHPTQHSNRAEKSPWQGDTDPGHHRTRSG